MRTKFFITLYLLVICLSLHSQSFRVLSWQELSDFSPEQLHTAKTNFENQHRESAFLGSTLIMGSFVEAVLNLYQLTSFMEKDSVAFVNFLKDEKILDQIAAQSEKEGYGYFEFYETLANIFYSYNHYRTIVKFFPVILNNNKGKYKINKAFSNILFFVALSHVALGEHEIADADLRKYSAWVDMVLSVDNGENLVARYYIAEEYFKMGRRDQTPKKNFYLHAADSILSLIIPKVANAGNDSRIFVAHSLLTHGMVLGELRNYKQSEKRLSESLKITSYALLDTASSLFGTYVSCLKALGELYLHTGQYRRAVIYLDSSLKKRMQRGEEPNMEYAKNLSNLAEAYSSIGDFENAETNKIDAAKMIFNLTEGKGRAQWAMELMELGVLYMKHDSLTISRVYLENCQKTMDTTVGDKNTDYLFLLTNICSLNKMEKKVGLNKEPVAHGLRIYDYLKKQPKPVDQEVLFLMGRLTSEAGYYDTAFYFLKQSLDRFNEAEKKTERYADNLSSIGIVQKNRPRYRKEAIGYLSRAAKVIRDLFSANVEGMNETEILHFKSELNNYNSAFFTFLVSDPKDAAASDALNSLLFFNGISERLLSRGNTGKKNFFGYNWQDIAKHLNKGETAVHFVRFRKWIGTPTDSALYAAFVMQPAMQKPLFIPLFDEQKLKDMLYHENHILKSPEDLYNTPEEIKNEDRPSKFALKELIWARLSSFLTPGSKVYYAPDGYLNDVNMDALSDKAGYLGDRYHLASLLSLVSIVETDKTENSQLNSFALLGGVNFESPPIDTSSESKKLREMINNMEELLNNSYKGSILYRESYVPLDSSLIEIDAISKIIRDNKRSLKKTLTGQEATKDNFKKMLSDAPEVVLVSTHAFFYPLYHHDTEISDEVFVSQGSLQLSSDPMDRTGLVFAGANRRARDAGYDCRLTAKEISKLDLSKIKLMILSGCETGGGVTGYGEGVFGMPRGFRLAGVRHLLLNLYEREDGTYKNFMVIFFKCLMNSKDIHKAFNAAQKKFRSTYPENIDWAGWVLLEK